MSKLKQYIDAGLDEYYKLTKTLSKTALNEVKLYKHKDTGKSLLLIKSNYRNDEVFRILKDVDTKFVLPKIYEVSSEEDALYVLEEYIEGDALSALMSAQKKLSAKQIKKYITDICDALNILHQNSIIHRDIKPDNIIIKSDGTACLIDLSISKTLSEIKNADTINLGTIGYAAPEQFGLTQSQPTTDIYALGVLMNELILGTHPTIEIPKGRIGKIIKKCTTLQISERYQNISEVKKAIKYL